MKSFLLMAIMFFSVAVFSQETRMDNSGDTNGTVFNKVEEEAEYLGGINAWKNFLANTLNPEVPIKRKAPAGKYTVIVKFIVTKTGKIDQIVAETNHGFGMEEEVIRVISKSGDWKPAQQNGRKVNAYRRQPITFVVAEEGRKKWRS